MAKKILLIEYEPRYLEKIRGYLVGRGYDLVVAKDGEEGLDAYRRSVPDLVLVSSVLPKVRTPDVIKGMQAAGGAPPIILMMSGYKGNNKRADAQRVGATSLLEKPFSEEGFFAEVDAALGGGSPAVTGPSGGGLLSSDDIFSDVLSGIDDAAPAAPAPGTDPGVQRRLEQTLSGILPAPKKPSTTSTGSMAVPPAARPAPPTGTDRTVRMDTGSIANPKPAPKSSNVDKLLTDTLSGLGGKKPAPPTASGSVSAPKAAPPTTTGSTSAPRPAASADPFGLESRPKPAPRPEPAPRAEPPAAPPPAAARPAPRPEPSTRTGTSVPGMFGRYNLLEKIAAGGMAEVYKARMRGEEGFEKIVAIKRILPHMADHDDFITMFVDEAKLAAQLTHNNIIHIYDLGKVDAYHYIAMEYVDGKDLRSILKLGQERGFPLPTELGLFVASKIANALDYAHRRVGIDGQELSLVHRDVSPQNILISFEGDIKLCDFGIAKATTKVSQTQTGALKGKLQYMSPEQAWGKKIDRRTDIFSLGVVLFEMLTGERLFTGDTDLTILEQVRDARVVAPSSVNPEVPKKVDQIVLKALAKNPQDRYQNASELEKDINAVLFSFQPAPGPADLAIYMHRLLEAQPVASDEQIDRAFASAEMNAGEMPVEEKKKGKGLVIAKKAAPAPAPTPAPQVIEEPPEVEEEAPKSRVGLYVGIAAAVAVLAAGGWVLSRPKKPVSGAIDVPPPQTVSAAAVPEVSLPATPATPAEPARVIDQKALDAEMKRIMAEKEKQLREAAGKGGATPVAAAPATAAAPSLSSKQPILPPQAAAAPTVAPTAAPVVAVKPTEVPPPPPKPTEPPVKVAEAIPAPKVPEAAPNVPAAAAGATAPLKEGDLVGPGEGVVEPRLVRLGAFVLPPQAKQIQRKRGEDTLGTVLVLALVTESGSIAETRVVKATAYKFVDDAAVNALRSGRIEPATKNGVRVKYWKTFNIAVKPS